MYCLTWRVPNHCGAVATTTTCRLLLTYIYLLAMVSIVSIYRKSNNQSRHTTKTMLNFKVSSETRSEKSTDQARTYLLIYRLDSETSKNSMKFQIVISFSINVNHCQRLYNSKTKAMFAF